MFNVQDKSVDSFRVDGLTSIVAVSPLMAMQGEVPLTEVAIRTQASVITFRTPTEQLDIFAQGAKDKVARLQASNAALEQALEAKCKELQNWKDDHRRKEIAIAGYKLQEMEHNRKITELRQKLANEQQERVIEDKKASDMERKLRATQAANTTQAAEIQTLNSKLILLSQQYEGRCQANRELHNKLDAKDKTIQDLEHRLASQQGPENVVNHFRAKFGHATKEAKNWKELALIWCNQRDDALTKVATLEGRLREARGHSAIAYNSWAPSYTTTSSKLPAACAIVNEKPHIVTAPDPMAGGRPMSTYDVPPYHDAMLFMYGKWLKGYKGYDTYYATNDQEHYSTGTQDKANQPLAWKPLN